MADDASKDLAAAHRAMGEGDFDGAAKKFAKVLKLEPDSAEAHFGRAEAGVAGTGVKVEDIMACYAKACELEPKNPFFLSNYASFCLQTGKAGQAEDLYKKAAEIDDENAGYYYNEFGYEYYQSMLKQYEGQLNAAMLTEVRKKAAKYLLKSVGVEVELPALAPIIK